MGAHIINSSLSYSTFDLGEGDYGPGDLDGQTALVTLAASLAADKGILVVNSAGNGGRRGISAPADDCIGKNNNCEPTDGIIGL